jgi:integrase
LPHCSVHGLRKAAACAAAENGATEMQMMAIFGWKTPDMARVYTRKARRSKMAGASMRLIADRQNKDDTNVSHFDSSLKIGGHKIVKNN